MLLAPTGVAAINIDGTTIHSGLGIKCHGNFYQLKDKQKTILRNKLSEVRLIIIDKILMVSRKLFFQVHQRLIKIFGSDKDLPFANQSVIVCGDMYQLPPVRPSTIYSEVRNINNATIHEITSAGLWHLFKTAELTEIMRQRSDNTLIEVRNKIRVGNIDDFADNVLASSVVSTESDSFHNNTLRIYSENEPANLHNKEMLSKVDPSLVLIKPVDVFPKNITYSEKELQYLRTAKPRDTGNLTYLLELKVGAKVMLTGNINLDDHLINGQFGQIMAFQINNLQVTKIYIKFHDQKAGLKAMLNDIFGKSKRWIPLERSESTFTLKRKAGVIHRTQFPVTLSHACMIHKVQGISRHDVVISFDLNKQKSILPGQIYVTLSRLTNLQGMYLIGNYSKSAIKANNSAAEEYRRLRVEQSFLPLSFGNAETETLTIRLLNTRSLNKHAIDIECTSSIIDTDLLCLTETQLVPGQNTATVQDILNNFNFFFNSGIDKFESVAVCYLKSIQVFQVFNINGISIFSVNKSSFFEDNLRIALLYKKQSIPISIFSNSIDRLMASEQVDIVLGNFNIEALDLQQSIFFNNLLTVYDIVVDEPTHLGGSLIDQVYVRISNLHQVFVIFSFQIMMQLKLN